MCYYTGIGPPSANVSTAQSTADVSYAKKDVHKKKPTVTGKKGWNCVLELFLFKFMPCKLAIVKVLIVYIYCEK